MSRCFPTHCRRLVLLAAGVLLACAPHQGQPDAGGDVWGDGGFDPAACSRLEHHDTGVGYHTQDCMDPTCGNGFNPPTGGLHCPVWLSCKDYATAQSRCNWIHNLEHGQAVLAYNCPSGCPDVVTTLEAIRNAQPQAANGVRQIIITPDPQLPKRAAAIVWGWSWSGDDIDVDAIKCLLSHRDGPQNYEHILCQP